jgi:hypothetical protein
VRGILLLNYAINNCLLEEVKVSGVCVCVCVCEFCLDCLRKTRRAPEDRRQKTEDRRQKTDVVDRRQKTEDRRQMLSFLRLWVSINHLYRANCHPDTKFLNWSKLLSKASYDKNRGSNVGGFCIRFSDRRFRLDQRQTTPPKGIF